MTECCSVCGRSFEVQFRYQMEEKDGGFAFFCSHACQAKDVRGEADGGVACDACRKRFIVELVSQVVRVRGDRRYACSEPCRAQVLAEAGGARLSAFTTAPAAPPWPGYSAPPMAPSVPPAPMTVPPPVPRAAAMASPLAGSAASSVTRPSAPPSFVAPPATVSTPSSAVSSPTVPSSMAAPTTVTTAATSSPATGGAPAAMASPRASAPAPSRRREIYGPRRLAIFNHKGGTGKTTTSVSLASGLAMRGLRVLLVDTDSQGNVGVSLDMKAERSLYHVLVMGVKVPDAAVTVRTYAPPPGAPEGERGGSLDVVVANETLAAAELYLAGRQNRDRILKERLSAAMDAYDVVLLDCSPSLSLMNQNALVTADGILVPVACDFLSLVGVRQVIKTVKNVNSLLHHPVQIFGVLPTFYDSRARICRDAVDTLKEHFGERCLPPVRATIKIKEAPAQGRTIYEYAPDSHAVTDYRRVVDFLVDGPQALRKDGAGADEATAASESEVDEARIAS